MTACGGAGVLLPNGLALLRLSEGMAKKPLVQNLICKVKLKEKLIALCLPMVNGAAEKSAS